MANPFRHRGRSSWWVNPYRNRHDDDDETSRRRRRRGHNNYYYIVGSGSGVFNTAVFMTQTRNLPYMPGMLPVVITKDKRRIRVGPYTTMNRL